MFMKALLDTNIVIHREASRVISRDIGNLYRWLDKLGYEKCIHLVTINEIEKNLNKNTVDVFEVKMQSYVKLSLTAELAETVINKIVPLDKNDHDHNDTILVNELLADRVDILVSEDKGVYRKAQLLGLAHRVYTISAFLEKCLAENPGQIDYKVLNVKRKKFGEISLEDEFFDSLKDDYPGFDRWFKAKSEEEAYVTTYKSKILSFLYLKIETEREPYPDISPVFRAKKRLKIGTFKVIATGFRLGERFLKIVFDNAIHQHVDEVYVTVLNKRDDQQRLIDLLERWGFLKWGVKISTAGEERVYVRDMHKRFDPLNPECTFPFFPRRGRIFLVPIIPTYHTDLLPDSILKTEDANDFLDPEPHRNAITKIYVSHAYSRDFSSGDLLVFYRTGGYYKSVVTTVAIVSRVYQNFNGVDDFIAHCRKHCVFTDQQLRGEWNRIPALRPFAIEFLCAYSFPNRPNLAKLIECGVIQSVDSAPRYPTLINGAQFDSMLKEAHADESFIVD